MTSWGGLIAPAKVPKPIIQKIHRDVVEVLREPEVRDRAHAPLGFADVVAGTPEGIRRALLRHERCRHQKLGDQVTAGVVHLMMPGVAALSATTEPRASTAGRRHPAAAELRPGHTAQDRRPAAPVRGQPHADPRGIARTGRRRCDSTLLPHRGAVVRGGGPASCPQRLRLARGHRRDADRSAAPSKIDGGGVAPGNGGEGLPARRRRSGVTAGAARAQVARCTKRSTRSPTIPRPCACWGRAAC